MARPVSIRRSLLLNLLSIVLLLSGSILLTIIISSHKTLQTLSQSLINQSINTIDVQLKGFFDPVISDLQIALAWGRAGLLNLDEPERLNKLLTPIIVQHSQVSSLMVANDDGMEHMVLHLPGKWVNRQTRRNEWRTRSLWLEWGDDINQATQTWKDLDYDPRLRPWFIGAKQYHVLSTDENAVSDDNSPPQQKIHWTEPYTFFTTKEPGITASASYNDGDEWLDVVGLDILLKDISKFTTQLHISRRGMVVVLTDKQEVIGLPAHADFNKAQRQTQAIMKTPRELGIKVISDAAEAFEALPNGYQKPFRFHSDSESWWAGIKPFRLNDARNLWIAVVVPEEDIIGDIVLVRYVVIAITLVILSLAIFRAINLANKYSSPIEALVQQSARIARGDLDHKQKIGSLLKEVHRLAVAQERMRRSLKSLFKLERDLQIAKQIQENTFPETLPQIDGFEVDAWIEPAEDTGGDTYDIVETGDLLEAYQEEHSHNKKIVFLLADATGHGIGPALIVTQLRSMLCIALRMNLSLAKIAEFVNQQIHNDMREGRFITAWLGELDPTTKTLTSFSAGQAPLFYYSAKSRQCAILQADTPPFGVLPVLDVEIKQALALSKGDIFAVFSDGVFDTCNTAGETFSIQRVQTIIEDNCHQSAYEILTVLREQLKEYAKNTKAADDRTAIIIKCTR
ncbi:MAG: SpoIIE family protein phosphatase [Gammaproteobacteria bacterium]|jgi:serine phosphatase RsbU (regulator of sigma subunit)